MVYRLIPLSFAFLLAHSLAVPARAADPGSAEQVAEMLALAENGIGHAVQGYLHGGSNYQAVAAWSDRVLETCRDPDLPRDKRIAALKAHVERMRKFEVTTAERFKSGSAAEIDAIGGKFLRVQAEHALGRAEAK